MKAVALSRTVVRAERQLLLTRVHNLIANVNAKRRQVRFRTDQRTFSSEIVSASEVSSAEAIEFSASPLGNIPRHGAGDSVIVLDVGGKEFKTLRSTIASNNVLASAVARAEANHEFSGSGNAIFIDRDPKHFGIILQHLRNDAEGLSYNSVKRYLSSKKSGTRVQLPTDTNMLRDIYVEAEHYGIPELQSSACEQSLLAWFFRNFGGAKSNPFDEVAKLMNRLKRGLVVAAGFVGVGQAGSLLDYFPNIVKKALFPEVELLQEKTRDENGKN